MRRKYFLAGLLLAALVLLYFNSIFLQDRICSERDLSIFFYPNIQTWVESLRSGVSPLWNPAIMCGEPRSASAQPALFYPLNLFYLLLPLDLAFNLMTVLHFFLAGVFIFLLMKEVQASDEAAAVSTLVFVFGGYLLSVQNVLSTLMSVTWLPAVLMCFLRAVRRSSRYDSLAGAVFLFCMFAGRGMEVFLMACGTLVLLSLFPCLHRSRPVIAPLGKRLELLGLTLGGFFLLGAVEVLPFLEILPHSIRSEGLDYNTAVLWSLVPRNILYLLIPDVFWKGHEYYWQDQSWLKTIYTGMIPLVLTGLFFLERGRRRVFVGLLMAGVLALSLGRFNPLYPQLFKWFPLLDTIRYPVKFFSLFILFVCLASGWGWDCFMARLEDPAARRLARALFFIFGFCGCLFLLGLETVPAALWKGLGLDGLFAQSRFSMEEILHNIKRVTVFTILGISWLFAAVRSRRVRTLAFPGIMLILLLDLFGGSYGYYQAAQKKVFHAPSKNMQAILQDDGLFRTYVSKQVLSSKIAYENHDQFLTSLKEMLYPNLLVSEGRQYAGGFSILSLKKYFRVLTLVQSAPLPDSTCLLNMLNVKYVLWHEPLNRPGYEAVRTAAPLYLYRNTNCLPRAFLAKRYRVPRDEEDFRQTLQRPDFDPRQTVLLSRHPDLPRVFPAEPPRTPERVQIQSYTNSAVSIRVESAAARFLVLSDTYFQGWKAWVDGKAVPVYEANYAFRAVAVPPGTHQVEFRYQPESFKAGLLISLVSLAAGMVFAVRGRQKGRVRK